MNTFNVLTFIQVRTDNNKFTQIFSVLTVIQARMDNNKFSQTKKGQG